MKATIRLVAACLVAVIGAACASTSVVVSEDGVSVATEGTAFLYSIKDLEGKAMKAKDKAQEACQGGAQSRRSIALRACKAATDVCSEFDPDAESTHCVDLSDICGSGQGLVVRSSFFSWAKDVATVAKSVSGLFPMHSFTLSIEADCNPAAL